MASGENHRSQRLENEQPKRITKKVRMDTPNEEDDAVMDQHIEDVETLEKTEKDTEMPYPAKLSYKEKLIAGEQARPIFSPQEIIDLVRDELVVGNPETEEPKTDRGAFNPKPVVPISLEEYEEWCRPWKYSLVIKLLGKRIGFKWMNQRIHHFWAREGDLKVIDLTDDYFLVRFVSEKDYLYALFEGPWRIADHYLLVQRWRPMFKPGDDEVRKIAVWVRFPKLPQELYNETFLWRAGSMLALGTECNVEYEGLHFICFECGRYGHKKEYCPELIAPLSCPPEPVATKTTPTNLDANQNPGIVHEETPSAETQSCFGPWMMAKRQPKRKPPKASNQGTILRENGTRFDVLSREPESNEKTQDMQHKQSTGNQESRRGKQQQGATIKQAKPTNKGRTAKSANNPKQNKENSPPTTSMQVDRIEKEQMKITPDEPVGAQTKEWPQSLMKLQVNLGDKFHDVACKANDPQEQSYDPHEEELRMMYALLQKKGVKDLNSLQRLYDASLNETVLMEVNRPPPP
ncbi:uncharacterized protein LOC130733658 [Lotus japonicus]|uniref:uncharacterized protein LOC130733658 n=1 Tax=Lotus japonicus TaxID=34305 RepID=UPI00258AE1C7|nr:uncharacterized protein LOC130733658 [Lotus japonicus]